MSKFNVGDKIKGNEKAEQYAVTNSDFVGYVIKNLNNGMTKVSSSKNAQSDTFCVDEDCFDLVERNLKGMLKSGDILETNAKDYYIYFETDDKRNLISLDGGHMRLEDYNNTLVLGMNAKNGFSIKKICRFDYLGDLVKFIEGERKLPESQVIWERKEIKEMTVEEISKALGYEIKVVK